MSEQPTDRARRWTPVRMAAFLRELRETQSVARAARSVGMGRQSAYKLRRRQAGQPFDYLWHAALEESRLEDALAPQAGSGRCPVCGSLPGLAAPRPPVPGWR